MKPSEQDRKMFEEYLKSHKDKPFNNPVSDNPIDLELKSQFPVGSDQELVRESEEFDAFFHKNSDHKELEDLTLEIKEQNANRRYSLVRTINFLEWAIENIIPSDTTLQSFWNLISNDLRNVTNKDANKEGSQTENYLVSEPETLLHVAKSIIELLEEDTNQQIKLPEIVEILKDKLDSLKGT